MTAPEHICDVEPIGIPGDWVASERRAAAAHAAVVAAERHADLRTRFALALTSGALSHGTVERGPKVVPHE